MNDIQFRNGLVPAIVRDARSGAILTLAYMNAESLQRTIESGETWFWSRSRNRLWKKGDTSGNTQRVVDIATDCDRDALVVTVIPAGPACHDGSASCFRNVPEPTDRQDCLSSTLQGLEQVLAQRRAERPEGSYSAHLFDSGLDTILKKVGEEATEVVIAAKGQSKERVVSEVADLVFHLSVLLVERGSSWNEVAAELEKRVR
ncbi:MAG TPA: bifunctional phosphoribosyl-AMP cyclohydrolase/phosphoribosyl-ATP diphosphatase HisIE [Thermoanaerobaculia bacterium]|nr:bifunctional phosphoribosyl-AMP cyclohydrolase/phosphoribosyl-ATP diphosphatase HisIE [Thermoanaerobaculia bacterium]